MADREKLLTMMPAITDANRSFWEGARAHRLHLQYDAAGRAHFPEIPFDPAAPETPLHWRPASGRGILWSWIVMHKNYLAAFRDETPYVVGSIELDEGPLVIARLKADPASLSCGMAMEACFEDLDDVRTLILFQPRAQKVAA